MLLFWIIQIVLLVVILFLFYLLSWFWPPDSPWAPWWTTNKEVARRMCRLVKMKKGDVMYDLGSGEGDALLVAAKEFGATGVGIEIDPLRVWQSNFKIKQAKLQDKVTILKKNFFEVDFSDATVVFAYLVPKALKNLKKKFLTELKPGTRIVCYRYTIDYLHLIAEDKEQKVYIYEIARKSSKKIVVSSKAKSKK
jgi:predicted RNA methylase